MIRKLKVLRSIRQFRRGMSVLYMTGDKAKEAYSPISPYIDFKSTLSDHKTMEDNLKFRKSSINFTETLSKYIEFNKMFEKKQSLEKLRNEISLQLKSLPNSTFNGE